MYSRMKAKSRRREIISKEKKIKQKGRRRESTFLAVSPRRKLKLEKSVHKCNEGKRR